MEFDLLYLEDSSGKQPVCAQDLFRDLKLELLLDAMSNGEKAVYDACAFVLARPLVQAGSIRLRNQVVRDAVKHGDVFEAVLKTALEALGHAKRFAEFVKPRYDRMVSNANKTVFETEMAAVLLECLKRLKGILASNGGGCQSEGMLRLCSAAQDTLDDVYLSRIQARLNELSALKQGVYVHLSCRLGEGLKQADATLNRIPASGKKGRVPLPGGGAVIPLSSVTLIQNAQEITEKALAPVHKIISGFNRSVTCFFERLASQTGFYAGCARLYRKLSMLGVPVCFPEFAQGIHRHEALCLTDAGLALKEGSVPVGSDVCLSHKRLVLITGPNQGGKTTFLRGVGLSQVMAQCGMFVAAKKYVCPVYTGIFTHFPNGEDARMRMGLLEVELSKMNILVDALKPGSLLLMNESFQTTTPGDSLLLAQEIIPALMDAGVKVLFVTHLYGYAADVHEHRAEDTLFLLAKRSGEGNNTYRIEKGLPFRSAYGLHLFQKVMGKADVNPGCRAAEKFERQTVC